jgi:hypothetical protein
MVKVYLIFFVFNLYNLFETINLLASGLSTGLESELPAFLLGQNAWQSQTVGQNYYDNTVGQNKYDSSKYQTNFTTPKIVNLEDTVPNKKVFFYIIMFTTRTSLIGMSFIAVLKLNIITYFPRQSLKIFTFCVKLSDSIFFMLGLSPIVKLI